MNWPSTRMTLGGLIASIAIVATTLTVTAFLVVPIARDVLERADGERWTREDANRFPPGGWTYDEAFDESQRTAAGLPPRPGPHHWMLRAEWIGLLAVPVLLAGLIPGQRAIRRHHGDRPTGSVGRDPAYRPPLS